MKALICMRENQYNWVHDALPGIIHPAMVRICNKPLLEYVLDFAILCGCTEARIILDDQTQGLREYFDHGERWGIDVSYGSSRHGDDLPALLEKNAGFCGNVQLLVYEGFFFFHYDRNSDCSSYSAEESSAVLGECATGSLRIMERADNMVTQDKDREGEELACIALRSVQDIYQTSLDIIKNRQAGYVLPGYSTDRGVILGRNVEIGKEVEIISPVIIGDNVRLLGKAVIGPDAVIDQNVIVDSGTTVERSVICEGSYLGRDLSVVEKLIIGRILYSGVSGESMTIEDAFLLSEIVPVPKYQLLRKMINSAAACILLLILVLPYLAITLLKRIRGEWAFKKVTYELDGKGKTIEIKLLEASSKSLLSKLSSALFLDRVPLLLLVLQGRLRLLGNALIEKVDGGDQFLETFPEYAPGVFSYSEADNLPPGSIESQVAERFYATHRSMLQDSKMLIKILLAAPYSSRSGQDSSQL